MAASSSRFGRILCRINTRQGRCRLHEYLPDAEWQYSHVLHLPSDKVLPEMARRLSDKGYHLVHDDKMRAAAERAAIEAAKTDPRLRGHSINLLDISSPKSLGLTVKGYIARLPLSLWTLTACVPPLPEWRIISRKNRLDID